MLPATDALGDKGARAATQAEDEGQHHEGHRARGGQHPRVHQRHQIVRRHGHDDGERNGEHLAQIPPRRGQAVLRRSRPPILFCVVRHTGLALPIPARRPRAYQGHRRLSIARRRGCRQEKGAIGCGHASIRMRCAGRRDRAPSTVPPCREQARGDGPDAASHTTAARSTGCRPRRCGARPRSPGYGALRPCDLGRATPGGSPRGDPTAGPLPACPLTRADWPPHVARRVPL